ncbi:MAG: hypothetical protein KY475_18310, partial [Planctomycetes bacterium]|nr:hypothetical protein [Planctomycetota bacterium]
WDLSPGYSPHDHPRFSRRIDDGCLYCHAGRVHYEEAEDGGRLSDIRYAEPIFAEEAIGCERCHGPGERHVQFHSGVAAASLSDSIVNPARLSPEKRESVCNQCHLLGQSVVPRSGRGFFDFRPGDALEDVYIVLSEAIPTEGAMRAVSQVEQMRASRCYQGSEGALGCISCHDPHSTPAPEQRAEFYRNRCYRCHKDEACAIDVVTRRQAPANNSCVYCHMPSEATRDVPHTALTDHRILRHGFDPAEKAGALASPGESDRLAEQAAEWIVFDQAEERLPPAEVHRAKGIALMAKAWERKDRPLAARALDHLLNAVSPGTGPLSDRLAEVEDAFLLRELGVGYMLLHDSAAAELCWRRLLEVDPHHESALMGLAQAAEERADLDEFRKYVERLSALRPESDEVLALRMKLRHYSGDLKGAATEAERALEVNPTLTELRQWLVELYRHLGREASAKRHQSLLKKLSAAQDGAGRDR